MTDSLDLPQKAQMLRLGGIGFILGALLILIGSLALPTTNLSDIAAGQQAFGDQAVRLQACALLMTFGFWSVTMGVVGVQSTSSGAGAAFAKIGLAFHLVGVALWTLGMSLDVSYPAAIVAWRAAPEAERAVAASVMAVLSPVGLGRGLFPMNVMLNWLAFTMLGIGIYRSTTWARWAGIAGLIIGIAGVLLGIAMTFTGREPLMSFFVILWVATSIWWLALGGNMLRHAEKQVASAIV